MVPDGICSRHRRAVRQSVRGGGQVTFANLVSLICYIANKPYGQHGTEHGVIFYHVDMTGQYRLR